MNKLRQVIRLTCQGKGIKTIHSMVGTSRNTIKKYLHIWYNLGLTHEEFNAKSDSEFSTLFATKETKKPVSMRRQQLESLLPEYTKRLKKRGITREMLHLEYINKYPDGYGRSRFNTAIIVYNQMSKPVMHIDHKAGDKLFIDFAGSKLQVTSNDKIEWDVEVFVAILGCSQLTYVEAVESQRKEDLIKACENALHYFESVPGAIIPDNLRQQLLRAVNMKR